MTVATIGELNTVLLWVVGVLFVGLLINWMTGIVDPGLLTTAIVKLGYAISSLDRDKRGHQFLAMLVAMLLACVIVGAPWLVVQWTSDRESLLQLSQKQVGAAPAESQHEPLMVIAGLVVTVTLILCVVFFILWRLSHKENKDTSIRLHATNSDLQVVKNELQNLQGEFRRLSDDRDDLFSKFKSVRTQLEASSGSLELQRLEDDLKQSKKVEAGLKSFLEANLQFTDLLRALSLSPDDKSAQHTLWELNKSVTEYLFRSPHFGGPLDGKASFVHVDGVTTVAPLKPLLAEGIRRNSSNLPVIKEAMRSGRTFCLTGLKEPKDDRRVSTEDFCLECGAIMVTPFNAGKDQGVFGVMSRDPDFLKDRPDSTIPEHIRSVLEIANSMRLPRG